MKLFGIFGVMAITGAATMLACADTATQAADAPPAADAELPTLDEGTSYNGWTQSSWLTLDACAVSAGQFDHTFARSYGDATRGGGGCAVYFAGASCSSDATCTSAARSVHGSSAFGYCYAGSCYTRPGSPGDLCVTGSNRAAGTLTKTGIPAASADAVLGCMTKASGPSSACGGSDGSLYMRTVETSVGYYYSSPCY